MAITVQNKVLAPALAKNVGRKRDEVTLNSYLHAAWNFQRKSTEHKQFLYSSSGRFFSSVILSKQLYNLPLHDLKEPAPSALVSRKKSTNQYFQLFCLIPSFLVVLPCHPSCFPIKFDSHTSACLSLLKLHSFAITKYKISLGRDKFWVLFSPSSQISCCEAGKIMHFFSFLRLLLLHSLFFCIPVYFLQIIYLFKDRHYLNISIPASSSFCIWLFILFPTSFMYIIPDHIS